MAKVHLLNYNNYINRRVLLKSTLQKYIDAELAEYDDITFKPNDGIDTEITLNIPDDLTPDYLVVSEVVNGSRKLASRWFITDRIRLREGQYKMPLHRDVFADKNDVIKNATIYCEKGYVADTDPLIFNTEGNTYNQIKTGEVLLKDATKSAWIVGYCDNKLMQAAENGSIDITINADTPAWTDSYNTYAAMLVAHPHTYMTPTPQNGNVSDTTFMLGFYDANDENHQNYQLYMSANTVYVKKVNTTYNIPCYNINALITLASFWSWSESENNNVVLSDKGIDPDDMAEVKELNNKIVRVGTASPYDYYQLVYSETETAQIDTIVSDISNPAAYEYVNDFILEADHMGIVRYPATMWTGSVGYTLTKYTAVWQNITINATASISDEIPLSPSAPYYMFVMPYHNAQFDDGTVKTANGTLTMQFVQNLIRDVGTHVIDVQLLPYFPDQYNIHTGVVDLTGVDTKAVTYLEDTNSNRVSFIYWGAPQTFNFRINNSIPALPSKKIDNETRFCRLNAPNYSASFDFSIAKNNGVNNFRVTCTYRPYQPHIQIIPEWGGVYGQYYADGRGLICGGDYSVDIVNDAWTEYQINNKNYQLIFDRQIQSMDLQHDVQRMNEKFSFGANVITAAAGAGKSYGAGAAIASGLGSLVGGVVDMYNNERLRADQRSAAFDMFNYNLGNIQARPTTITKLSALVGNNKIWPFYEIYSATAREVSNLNLQLQYSGMTVGAIGKLSEFIGTSQTFVRGRLIRITGLDDDTHIAQIIADELARGIYMNS
ncbi:MAG: hypothetical protein J5547_05765 [Clostridia bacterium]|nr:hypothetical protein [Clostridia bacterium]